MVLDQTGGFAAGLKPWSVTLVLGGARSGKSHYAENLILAEMSRRNALGALYLATAEAGDDEMSDRIVLHHNRRGRSWETIEAPRALPETLRRLAADPRPILVDCLTLWLSNLLLDGADLTQASDDLIDALTQERAPVVLVANEVGLGIVPDNRLARAFRDAAGRLNQAVAARADQVFFLAAGLPLQLK